ncbi:hypothetical protein ASPSYDRAFT_41283 [Aspergillus sydowii CBS 593.65]|uniref:Invertebrate defensins family profile domain-containing protein n=1 Tax=Aspergillus sydowii CBS 593.65 TaxID=1036612 RepID=A0A1L9TT31_9EURO|nr:uncharacterized protein ASPSYDRAFT_41283 [Aspergillus sydowii CBS 593.65]OJJ62589.1 hypothetical protein ASPSYDRAFT_41283 [Aspergillus sydowii CBS 593.65]
MRFTINTIVLAAVSAAALGSVIPDANDPGTKLSRAESDLFARAINCPCTSSRTCGCGGGSWCHCEEPNNNHAKAFCTKNNACGCPGGSYGYCVPT